MLQTLKENDPSWFAFRGDVVLMHEVVDPLDDQVKVRTKAVGNLLRAAIRSMLPRTEHQTEIMSRATQLLG